MVKVLVLSPYPEKLQNTFDKLGDEVVATDQLLVDIPEVDWIVSYGYRNILKGEILSRFKGRLINIHISMLPWNKGADPNFWSWLDRTPKGVTIHMIDAGIDTGDILVQSELNFSEEEKRAERLSTSYEKLHLHAIELFGREWQNIREGKIVAIPQKGVGSFHRMKDKELYWCKLPLGYQTPVLEIERLTSRE